MMKIQSDPWTDGSPRRRRLGIDFDGVIHNYDRGWQDGEIYGEPIPGAFEHMAKLQKEFDLYILTTRATPETWFKIADESIVYGAQAIRFWMRTYGAAGRGLDVDALDIGTEKKACMAYIDDRAVRFTNWPDIRKMFQ